MTRQPGNQPERYERCGYCIDCNQPTFFPVLLVRIQRPTPPTRSDAGPASWQKRRLQLSWALRCAPLHSSVPRRRGKQMTALSRLGLPPPRPVRPCEMNDCHCCCCCVRPLSFGRFVVCTSQTTTVVLMHPQCAPWSWPNHPSISLHWLAATRPLPSFSSGPRMPAIPVTAKKHLPIPPLCFSSPVSCPCPSVPPVPAIESNSYCPFVGCLTSL